MRKLIIVIVFLGLANSQTKAQVNTTLGGTNCHWNLPPTLTVLEGTILNVTASISPNGAFWWSTSSAKFAVFHTPINYSGVNHSSVIVEFKRAGVYQITVIVNSSYGFGGRSANVIVIPKSKLSPPID